MAQDNAADPGIDFAELDRQLDYIAQAGRRLLLEHEVYAWLEAAGLGTPPAHRLLGAARARDETSSEAHSDRSRASELIGERIVLKVSHPRILHKSEVHGVQIVPRAEMEARAEAMRREVPAHFAVRHGEPLEGFERLPARILAVELVESVATPGAELLVGIRGTREFGPTLVLGWGGAQAEYMAGRIKPGRAICTVSPLLQTDQEIWESFGATVSCDALLGKLPGSTPATTEPTLRAWLARLAAVTRRYSSASAEARWWIEELEVNPVVFRNGRPVPLDGILRFQPSEPPRARPPAAAVRALLHPERIALVGVSTKGRNVARIILDNLRAAGTPTDRLAIVKPGTEEIDGVACFPSVAALPWTCDLLCISIAAASVPACIRESVEHRKAHAILLVTGGMGETKDGKAVEKEIGEILADARRRLGSNAPALLGGNSLGLQSRPASVDTLFIPESKLPRPDPAVSFGDDLAIASQSGAFLVSRESSLEGLAPRYAVSTGNQIDIGIADLVEAWSADDAIAVIGCYIEGFRNGEGLDLARAIRAATDRGKRVIVYKAGRTPAGRTAAQGHTAALASDWDVTRAFVEAAGGLMCATFREWSSLLALSTRLAGRSVGQGRLAALSNAGFETVGLADHLPVDGELRWASFGQGLSLELATILEEHGLQGLQEVRNPLDVTPMASDAVHLRVLSALHDSADVDVLVAGCVPLTGAMKTTPDEISDPGAYARGLSRFGRPGAKPLVVVVDAGPLYDEMARRIAAAGLPVFRSADEAVRLLDRWASCTGSSGREL